MSETTTTSQASGGIGWRVRATSHLPTRWLYRHRGIMCVELIWLLFAANFSYGFLWGGDAQVPYTFLRRLFGANVHAAGYQFGLAFFEAPFYLVGKAFEAGGWTTFRTHPTNQVFIALGTVFYVAAMLALVYRILAFLGLRHPAAAAGVALFGSPVFFYGVFSPGQTHVVDALLATALVLVAFVGFNTGWRSRTALLAGAVTAVATTVRPLEVVLGAALMVALVLFSQRRAALLLGVSAAASFLALAAIPLALGASILEHRRPTDVLRWSPESPFEMLFSLERGLFVWTPATALAVVGYVVLLRRKPEQRPFLVALGLMAVALVCVQALVPFWQAGWSFSERYLVGLFPFVAIGIGGLFTVRWRLALVATISCTIWSLFLALAMVTLPFTERGGANTLVHLAGQQSVGSFAYGVWHISHLKILVPGHPFASN